MSIPRNYPYRKWMTYKEWNLFEANFRINKVNKSALDYLINNESGSFADLLFGAFRWDHTDQGHDFWRKISEQKAPLSKQEQEEL